MTGCEGAANVGGEDDCPADLICTLRFRVFTLVSDGRSMSMEWLGYLVGWPAAVSSNS